MQPIFFIILIGLAGGMAIGIQGPLSSVITQRLGSLESVFIIHAGGALAALMPMMFVGSRLGEWRSVPWYALGAGALGLIVITAMG
ncbi:MAG: DMT family transporter, partial [Anaerolineales bacterium]|nr:DMT family transporter [Anaerolineales bacterium]